jgi:hypothetical protein
MPHLEDETHRLATSLHLDRTVAGERMGAKAGLVRPVAVGRFRPLMGWIVLKEGFNTTMAGACLEGGSYSDRRDQWARYYPGLPLSGPPLPLTSHHAGS